MCESRGRDEEGKKEPHFHRSLIGFDERGIPTVTHSSHCDDDPDAFIKDYTAAVAEYRKTFPSKSEVLEKTPDPAVRDMMLRAEQ